MIEDGSFAGLNKSELSCLQPILLRKISPLNSGPGYENTVGPQTATSEINPSERSVKLL